MKALKKLTRSNLKEIQGGWIGIKPGKCDLTLCGCSCSGAVTGPACCQLAMACPQVYNC